MEYSSVLASFFIVIPIVHERVSKERKNQTQQLETVFISANGVPAEANIGNDGLPSDFLCDEQKNGIENKNIQSVLWQKL